jgi:hypothetical protein
LLRVIHNKFYRESLVVTAKALSSRKQREEEDRLDTYLGESQPF